MVRPCLRTRYPTPPPRVMPADPDRAGVAEADGQPVGARRGGDSPAVRPVWAQAVRLAVSMLQRLAGRDRSSTIPPSHDAVAGDAVPAAADGQLQPGLGGERDHLGDVGGVGGPDDGRRPAVEPAVEQRSGLVVAGVVGGDHPAVDGRAQLPSDRKGLGAGV